ncbi:hypothetical protein ACFZAG_35930 [Streptomyces sp. NPDC012403]|uniref:hypothetical protein n=1 Tax=Streptomyces sp. NPDC012403 TaxID=3364831 RepID=UPI0036E53269
MDALGQGSCGLPARLVEERAGGLADLGDAFADPYERAVLGSAPAVVDLVADVRAGPPGEAFAVVLDVAAGVAGEAVLDLPVVHDPGDPGHRLRPSPRSSAADGRVRSRRGRTFAIHPYVILTES